MTLSSEVSSTIQFSPSSSCLVSFPYELAHVVQIYLADLYKSLDVFFEIPSNLLLKKLSPRVWLSICGLGFGLVMVFQGLTQNYSGILATRFFLGLFECGMFPGCFYLLGMWYKRSEAQKRFTFFFCSTSLAGAFGGLLASAIGKSESLQHEGS